jgi:hypothetical protein
MKIQNSTKLSLFAVRLAAPLAFGVFMGCGPDKDDSPGDKAGDAVEEAGESVEEGAEEVGDEIDDATDDN